MASEAKQLLEAALQGTDGRFGAMEFMRRRNSASYVRTSPGARHIVEFSMDQKPRAFPGADAHLHPTLRVEMPDVTSKALELVAGDASLLASAPELVVSQPLEMLVPTEERRRWTPRGAREFKTACDEIVTCVETWVLPFVRELDSPAGLLRVAVRDDAPLLRQQHFWIFVSAAYLLVGDASSALAVLERRYRAPALRRRYAHALGLLRADAAP